MDTSDGISDADWGVIEQCAEAIVEASSFGVDDKLLVSNLFSELRRLECVYGRLPSLLATKADFVEDDQVELSLLREAYTASCEISDSKNKTYISASLVEFYIDSISDEDKAEYWLGVLSKNIGSYSDDYIESVYKDSKMCVWGQCKN